MARARDTPGELFEPLCAFFSPLLPPSLRAEWCWKGGRVATFAGVDSGERIDVFFGVHGREDELVRRLRLIKHEVHDYSWIEASLSAGVRVDPRPYQFSVLDESAAQQRHFRFPAQDLPPQPDQRDDHKPSKLSQVTFPASSSSGAGSGPSPSRSGADIEQGGASVDDSNEEEIYFDRAIRAGRSLRREGGGESPARLESEEEQVKEAGQPRATYADDSAFFDNSVPVSSPSRKRRSPSRSSEAPNWIEIPETSPPPVHRALVEGIPATRFIQTMEEMQTKTVKLEEEDAVLLTAIPAPATPSLTPSPFFSSLLLPATSTPTIPISSFLASLHTVLPGNEGDRGELQKGLVHLKKGEAGFDARRRKKGP